MPATLAPPKPRAGRSRPPQGVFTSTIAGRYRPITVHQLAMVWWLYHAKHITARQLRIVFAAHEMHERRRYTHQEPGQRPRKPSYTLDEIRALTGSQAADADLTADVKALGRLGLVAIGSRSIEFAVSIEQITLPPETSPEVDSELPGVGGFWAFFDQLPNSRRKVPVPRRTVRALAKGFSRGVNGMMIALLIRSLYWHRPPRKCPRPRNAPRNTAAASAEQGGTSKEASGGVSGGGGRYRIDGRTKCSWIAEVFGISRRSVTDARAALIDTGWLVPVDCPQWQLNKWGQRYTINVEAFGPKEQGGACRQAFGLAAAPPSRIASPPSDNPGEIASPCLNNSAPSTKEGLKTRRPDPARSDCGSVGSRKKKSKMPPPRISNIRGEDFGDTARLHELHRQAIEAGYDVKGEKGRLDFFALA
ncbi:MAG: hypothetical protein AAGL98_00800, partial [Planctomycetota bacterium]